MRKSNKLIKNFLTTASTIAVIIGGVESSFAMERVTTKQNATIGGNGLTTFNDGDNIKIQSKNTMLNANGNHRINKIDVNGRTGTSFIINGHNVTVGEISSNNQASMPVTMTTGSLTLTGNNIYGALGKINGGTLNINNEGINLTELIGNNTILTAINVGTNANDNVAGLDGGVTFDEKVESTTINVGGRGGDGSVAGEGAKGGDGSATFKLGVNDVDTLNIGGDGGDGGDVANGENGGKGGDAQASFGSLDGIRTINIGGKDGDNGLFEQGGKGGRGNLILDVKDGNIELPAGQDFNFHNSDSWLFLTNSSATDDRSITLLGNFAPNNGDDAQGNLEVNSSGDKKLTINVDNDETIGTDNTHRLDTLKVSGDKLATINPKIFARKIIIDNTEGVIFGGEIDLGEGSHLDTSDESFSHIDVQNDIAQSIEFKENTKLESINPNDKNFTMKVARGKTLSVDYIGDKENNTALVLYDGAALKPNLSEDIAVYLKAIHLEKSATLAAGTYTVPEILAYNADGIITLGNGFTLFGGINTTGGAAADFNLEGNATIHEDIGTSKPVGTITIDNDGGELWLGGSDINAKNIKGSAGNEKLKFINENKTTVTSKIGKDAKFASIEFSNADVEFVTDTINADEFIFSKDDELGTTVVTSTVDFSDIKITSTRDNNNLVVGNKDVKFGKDVGTMQNKFGNIILTSDDKVEINTGVFHAVLVPDENNTGTVDVNYHDGYIWSIGNNTENSENLFKKVKFKKSATVYNIYANEISIKDNVTANLGNAQFGSMALCEGAIVNFNENFNGGTIDGLEKEIIVHDLFEEEGEAWNLIGNGTVNFEKEAVIDHELGVNSPLKKVTFADKTDLKANITAETISFGGHEVNVQNNDSILSGDTNFNNSTINLDRHLVLAKGVTTFSGDITINTNIVNITEPYLNPNLVASEGSSFNMEATNELIFDVQNDEVGAITGQKIIVIGKDGGDTSGVDLAKIKPRASEAFSDWKAERDENGHVVIVNRPRVVERLRNDRTFTGTSEEVVTERDMRIIEDSIVGTQAYAYRNELGRMNSESRMDSLERTSNTNNIPVHQITHEVVDSATNNINSRISSFVTFTPVFISTPQAQTVANVNIPAPSVATSAISTSSNVGSGSAVAVRNITPVSTAPAAISASSTAGSQSQSVTTTGTGTGSTNSVAKPDAASSSAGTASTKPGAGSENGTGAESNNKSKTKKVAENTVVSGVAAGDDVARYGIWGSPIYGDSTQGTSGSIAGFRAKSYGMTVGFDTKVTDDTILGAAFSYVNSEAKYKSFKSGDKTKMKTLLASIYGMKQFSDLVFAQSVFTFASTDIDNRENRRTSNTTTQVAKGKYRSTMFGLEVLGGYNQVINNQFVVTPMLGFDYKHSNAASYTETGTTSQNRTVKKKAFDKLDIILGARLSCAPITAGDLQITPEIHAFVKQDALGKAQAVSSFIPGQDTTVKSAKPTKTTANVGVGLNVTRGMIDTGISYDVNLAKKFVGHQGALKLRVNF